MEYAFPKVTGTARCSCCAVLEGTAALTAVLLPHDAPLKKKKKKSSKEHIDQYCMVCEFLKSKRNREETPSVPFCDTQNSLETLFILAFYFRNVFPPYVCQDYGIADTETAEAD